MLYEYACKFGHGPYDVYLPLNRVEISQRCPECRSVMTKLYSFNGQMSFGTFKPGHYHAFGKTFTQKHQLDNELKRIKGETGKELVEVGNDSLSSVRPEKRKYDVESAARELKSVWHK